MSGTTAERKVSRLARLGGFESKDHELPPDIVLREGERVLGRYTAGASDEPIIFTTLGLRLSSARGWRFLPYEQISGVSALSKDPPADRLSLITGQGEVISFPVRASARTSEAFELVRFLDRARAADRPLHQPMWTHPSVVDLAAKGENPIQVITGRARKMVFEGIEVGWKGPPFDPLALARLRQIELRPESELDDARLVPTGRGFRIEYNPNRPVARIRYSIAHELAHSLFADAGAQTRNRGRDADEWQLELLCNVAAAELLMPIGSLSQALENVPVGVDAILALRERFLVSVEAVAIRLARASATPLAAFAARYVSDDKETGHYELEYVIASPSWLVPRLAGHIVPDRSVVGAATAVGFTARSTEAESWDALGALHVEAIGAPPYPDSLRPRVVGLFWPWDERPVRSSAILYERGDALSPIGTGQKLVAHIVNDKAVAWGGRSFASQVRTTWPTVQASFRAWAAEHGLQLGSIHVAKATDDISVVSLVAQHGYRPTGRPLIRYDALEAGLRALADVAHANAASVHMPRIGTGNAGGNWDLIVGMIEETLVARGIRVTIYDFPSPDPTRSALARRTTS